jgi:riboflavin kinase / FMN adenylyltransferase
MSDSIDSVVACIGVFDGVHRGHRTLIDAARAVAERAGLPLVAITFFPHPAAVLRPQAVPPQIASLEDRISLLLEAGADAVEVIDFTPKYSEITPVEFIEDALVSRMHAEHVVVGENFRFGSMAAGTPEVLIKECAERGITAHVIPVAADSAPWSSTRIRRLVAAGAVDDAAEVLGRPFSLTGTVVHGDHRGRELGYPTANVQTAPGMLVPADGVYAGWLDAAGERFPAAISVGTNPQFEGAELRVEAYCIDRTGLDLYDLPARVTFVRRLREQAVFDSLPAFLEQMALDVDQARFVLGGLIP